MDLKKVLIIGNGISGLSGALRCMQNGMQVILASPFPPERAQSVMAAGGINAVLTDWATESDTGDSVSLHIEDTLKAGAYLGGKQSVTGLCTCAEEIIRELEKMGTVFSTDASGAPARRNFGGHSRRRTCYCGTSTGKQIVTALSMEIRRYEADGRLIRMEGYHFYSGLIRNGICYGALLLNDRTQDLEAVYADAVVMAVGGMNALFGKTTGSVLCDGYAAGRLFMQGVELKNLEFIQYHPTTLETAQKRILISEAARGEGGRLFYRKEERQTEGRDDSGRVYFMEEKYGSGGNLMTRDVTSREIASVGKQVYLDLSFLGEELIDRRLPEVREVCRKFGGIDIAGEPVPVGPAVHFFMGGIAVHLNHETSIRNLYAVGECASMYHGANRLGGNSTLSACYSGRLAADAIANRMLRGTDAADEGSREASEGLNGTGQPDFTEETERARQKLQKGRETESRFPVMYIRDLLAETMNHSLGMIRDAAVLEQGIADVNYYQSVSEQLRYDSSVSPYENYSLEGMLAAAKATLACAAARRESRGAHWRSDYPETDDRCGYATIVSWADGGCHVRQDVNREYER